MILISCLKRDYLKTWMAIFRLMMTLTILVGMVNMHPPIVVHAAPKNNIFQTMGDFFSLGANTIRELQKAIDMAGDRGDDLMVQMQREIQAIMNTLEEKYQNNLNITLNSIDQETHNLLLKLQSKLEYVNKIIQEDIESIKYIIEDTLQEIREIIADLDQTLKNTILYAGITGEFLIDKTTNSIIVIITIVLLGAGLIIFATSFNKKPPRGRGRYLVLAVAALFLLFFISLLIPPVRKLIMTNTGVGLEATLNKVANTPRIGDIYPDPIIVGETKKTEIWGTNLNPAQNTTLEITIGGIVVPYDPVNSGEYTIIIDVGTLQVSDEQLGANILKLTYSGTELASKTIYLEKPKPVLSDAQLQIESFEIEPNPPLVNAYTKATIRVCNTGEKPAENFFVQWTPTLSAIPQKDLQTALAAGECVKYMFDQYQYSEIGDYQSVAEVDPDQEVDETNEEDNSKTLLITVTRPTLEFGAGSINFTNFGLKRFSFMGHEFIVPSLPQGMYDTGISTATYDCGITGYEAAGGDIDEDDTEDILVIRTFESGGTWWVNLNFNTHEGDNESWAVNLMCIDNKYRSSHYKLIRDIDYEGYLIDENGSPMKTAEWNCGLVGMAAQFGDIEEDHSHSVIMSANAFAENGQWKVEPDFVTGGKTNEHWILDALCINPNVNSVKWYFNQTGFRSEQINQTDVLTSEYTCGIVGVQALNGDLNEKGDDGILLSAWPISDSSGYWNFRTDIRTHDDHEDWTIDYLCASNAVVNYVP
jgi:hypothetical protein